MQFKIFFYFRENPKFVTAYLTPLKKVFSLPSFLFASQKESDRHPSLLLLSRRRKRGGSQDFK